MADEMAVTLWFILVSAGRATSSGTSCFPELVLLPSEQEFRICSETDKAKRGSPSFGGLPLILSLKI